MNIIYPWVLVVVSWAHPAGSVDVIPAFSEHECYEKMQRQFNHYQNTTKEMEIDAFCTPAQSGPIYRRYVPMTDADNQPIVVVPNDK